MQGYRVGIEGQEWHPSLWVGAGQSAPASIEELGVALPFVTGQYRQCHQPVERQETAVVATVEHHSMTSAVAVAVAVVPKDV